MDTRKMGTAVVSGVIAIFIIAFSASIIFSLLLKFTKLTEDSINWAVLTSSFLALFIGGFISGGKGQSRGWLLGAATGLCFTLIVSLLQFLGYDHILSTEQLSFHLSFLGVSILGGVLGVNMTSKRQ